MLRMVDEDPVVDFEYLIGNETTTRTVSHKASDYRYLSIPINDTKFTVKGVRIPSVDASGYTFRPKEESGGKNQGEKIFATFEVHFDNGNLTTMCPNAK